MYGIALPEAQVCAMLHQFMREHFSWTTCEHFRLAFEMNAANKLDRKVEHFSAVSVTFLGDVLTLYKPHRDKVNLELQRLNNEPKEEVKDLTDEEQAKADEELWKIIEQHKSGYKIASNRIYMDIWAYMCSSLLQRSGTITNDTYTESEKQELLNKARKIVYGKKELTKSRVSYMNDQAKRELKEAILYEFHKQIYYKYLSQF